MGVNILRLATAALLIAISAGAASGEDAKRPLAVVELFTSQGCNSCPPADENLSDLARSRDVVTLAYHVDYWDYLGWRDTLASPDNTARQHEYNRALGNRSVYTPQAIVNGRKHVNGAKRYKLDRAIDEMAGTDKGLTIDVDASYEGRTLVIDAGASASWKGVAQVVLVYFNPATAVTIGRGENAGREFTYRHAVSGFHTVGMWHGKAARFEMPISEIAKKGAGGCAVLVQEMLEGGLPGAILGATILYKPSS